MSSRQSWLNTTVLNQTIFQGYKIQLFLICRCDAKETLKTDKFIWIQLINILKHF